MMKKLKKGFTLIELLVVIAIIAILITVGSVSYTRALRLSRDSKRKTDLEQIRQALETYRSESATGSYPVTGAAGLTALQTAGYINTVPVDPKAPTSTYVYTLNSATTYSLCATLESGTVPSYCVYQP
jgi:general secretion pathway protein G